METNMAICSIIEQNPLEKMDPEFYLNYIRQSLCKSSIESPFEETSPQNFSYLNHHAELSDSHVGDLFYTEQL
jgi:hypothetical protein